MHVAPSDHIPKTSAPGVAIIISPHDKIPLSPAEATHMQPLFSAILMSVYHTD